MKTKLSGLYIVLFIQLLTCNVYGQAYYCEKTIEESLQETAEVLNLPESKALWKISLNASVILVDPSNNKMFFTAIENGKVQAFTEESWDNKVQIANSTTEYNGKKYVTVILDALKEQTCEERISLLAHEIFHLYQDSLGIKSGVSLNYHMDKIEGRALLRIEMKMLQQALEGDMQCLYDALYIRAYRQSMYPDNNEELFELIEGLAEYTGAKLSGVDIREYVKKRLNYDISSGYTNAFGYVTGAAYAVLLDEIYPEWRYDKDLTKGMIYLLEKTDKCYAITPDSLSLKKLLNTQHYDLIVAEEVEELQLFGDITLFEGMFKPESSKLCIKMNLGVSFAYNPNDRVITLSDGVLLRNMTLAGEWGQIKIEKGLVRLKNWSAFYLQPPTEITGNQVEGDGYKMHINQGWKVIKEDNIYRIEKE
jgi:hypothetical protein